MTILQLGCFPTKFTIKIGTISSQRMSVDSCFMSFFSLSLHSSSTTHQLPICHSLNHPTVNSFTHSCALLIQRTSASFHVRAPSCPSWRVESRAGWGTRTEVFRASWKVIIIVTTTTIIISIITSIIIITGTTTTTTVIIAIVTIRITIIVTDWFCCDSCKQQQIECSCRLFVCCAAI